VEVAELLSAESGGAAGDSGNFDMSAGFAGCHVGVGPLVMDSSVVYASVDVFDNFFVVAS
jgi:hypothetical protein